MWGLVCWVLELSSIGTGVGGRLGGLDVDGDVTRLSPLEEDLADGNVGVGVDNASEELFDGVVGRIACFALHRGVLVVAVMVHVLRDRVRGGRVLVLVVLHIPLLVVTRDWLGPDSYRWFIRDLIVLGDLLLRRSNLWSLGLGGCGLELGGGDRSLLVMLADALTHVVVELAGARLVALELIKVDTPELAAPRLQVLDEVLEEVH